MNKLSKLGYTKIEMLIIVVLLGIVAFITINKTSYAFAIDNTKSINEVYKLIELQAEEYAMDNLDIFKETETTFISVDELVKNNYLIGNSEGYITNPADSSKKYNDNKIKLEYNSNKKEVTATLIN